MQQADAVIGEMTTTGQEALAEISGMTATLDDADADPRLPIHVLIPTIGVSSALLWAAVVAATRGVMTVLH